jgi:hypothetical protein
MKSQKLRPCSNCPFRTDKSFKTLRESRCHDIHDGLMGDQSFGCHKTTSGGESTKDSKQCIGAAIYLEKTRPGGMMANLAFRLSAMFNPNDPVSPNSVDIDAPVVGSLSEFIEHASDSYSNS